METLRRSRNTTTAVTANGEVQSSEEAQVYVHDLDFFVPGLSVSSGSNPSSTSTLQDLSSPDPAEVRSDGLAPGNWPRTTSKTLKPIKKKSDDNRDSDDPLQVLPEWLEEFIDNLEDTEVPAHISHDSDSERSTKVV